MARHTCEARIYPTGSVAYIPWMCTSAGDEFCALPAVDYRVHDGRKIWYCVKHWDRVQEYKSNSRMNRMEADHEDEVGQVLP